MDERLLKRVEQNVSSLTTLDLQNKNIGADGVKHLAEALKLNTSITKLNLRENNIGADGAKHLAEALKLNASITVLDLYDNNIGDDGAEYLAYALIQNTSITELYLSGTNIGADGAKRLAEALEQNTSITALNLENNNIGGDGAKLLAEALKLNTSITTLNLSYNYISGDGTKYIAEALKENTSITILDLRWNNIGADGAKRLAEALEQNENTSITKLGLENNNIGDDGAKLLAEALKENTSITTLNLSYNYISGDGTKHLAEALKKNSSITELNLFVNNIGADGAKHLAEALKLNTSITALNLEKNNIGDDGAKLLAEALKLNTSITELNLGDNNIGADGAKYIAEALKQNTSITTLNLKDNKIGDDGAKHLAEALKENTSTTELNLEANDIGVDGAKHLAEALKENTSITELNLEANFILAGGAKYIAEALKENTSITILILFHNNIGDGGAKHLAEALEQNTSITGLNLRGNDIGVDGAKHLAEALKENTSITTLNLRGNDIGDDGAKYLAEALEQNTSITKLHLRNNNIGDDGAKLLAKAITKNNKSKCNEIELGDNNITDIVKEKLNEVLRFNDTYKRENAAPAVFQDSEDGNDEMGRKHYADALAEVISYKNMKPPFVLALIGSWGSGKSFMFNLMKKKIQEIEREFKNPFKDRLPYVGHTYVVCFNSWTYSKGDLWSSLMYRILIDLNEQLHVQQSLRKLVGDERLYDNFSFLEFMEELKTRDSGLSKLFAEDESVIYDKIQKELTNLILQGNNVTKALAEVVNNSYSKDKERLTELNDQIERSNTINCFEFLRRLFGFSCESLARTALDNLSKGMVNDVEAQNWRENKKELMGCFNWLKQYVKLVSTQPYTWIWLVLVVSIYLAMYFLQDHIEEILTSASARLISIIAPAIVFILRYVNEFCQYYKQFKNLAKEIDSQFDLEKVLEKGKCNTEALLKEKEEIEKRIWLMEGESLQDALNKANISEYEKNLSIVHTAQKDLTRLVDAISSKKSKNTLFPRGDARILLFIDDLDRCSPDQVVKVLEATQLLVKSDAFIVVLVVDSKYVTLSLEKSTQYGKLLHRERSPTGLDFLEKIIQLPFRIPPIEDEVGTLNYTKSHFQNIKKKEQITPLVPENDSKPAAKNEVSTAKTTSDETEKERISNPDDKRRSIPQNEMEINEDDIDFLSKLFFHYHISGNGRTMKRLTNIVKVLLILWDRHYSSINNELKKLSYLILVMCSSPHLKLLMQKVMEHHEKTFHKTLSQTDEKMWYEILFKESLNDKELKLLETHGGYVDFDGAVGKMKLITKNQKEDFMKAMRLVRCFCFVGESAHRENMNEIDETGDGAEK